MSTTTATTSRAVPEAHRLDGLLAASGPPRRAGALAAASTFGWRAMLKIKHEPKQLTDVIAIPVVFTVLFTYIFGGAIGGSPATTSRPSCPERWSWASPPSPCTAAPASPRT
jgi:ABC-2 type transport system permease protein